MASRFLYFSLIAFACIYNASAKLSVYRALPRSDEHLSAFQQLSDKLKGIQYWKEPNSVNETIDVLVSDDHLDVFKSIMQTHNLEYEVQVPDLQELLNNAVTHEPDIQRRSYRKLSGSSDFGWTRFHTLDEIYSWLDSLAATYPERVEVIVGGKTYEKREIRGVRLNKGKNLPVVIIEGGIHAREWLSHATATYLINQLLSSQQPEIRSVAESFEWYIFPVLNPDGYVYTHINPQSEKYRLWRKSRAQHSDCYGTDLNRNWDFKWGGTGSDTKDSCSEVFAGTSPFSEIETKSISDFFNSLKGKVFAYVGFHTYTGALLFPYGHTKEHLENYDEQYAVGTEAIKALSKKHSTRYTLGNIVEIVGVCTGTTIDWAKEKLDATYSYVYEMRGKTSDGRFYGFVAPPSEILPNAEEMVDSVAGLLRAAAKRQGLELKA